jgi:uncharacterized protein
MRPLIEADLVRLNTFLLGLGEDAMMLSELDGFLAGIIVCPELVSPSEWLPLVWGEDGPVVESLDAANDMLGVIMTLHNSIKDSLDRPNGYAPCLDSDGDDGDVWELWASGFGRSLDLRPWVWAHYAEMAVDDPNAKSFRCLQLLAIAADTPGGIDLPEQLEQALSGNAGAMLAACVADLHRLRIAELRPQQPPCVGRNDPCPCGSGKKYKKCCLRAESP